MPWRYSTIALFTTSNESISCWKPFLWSNTRAYRVLSYRSKEFPMRHFALELCLGVWNLWDLRLIIALAGKHSEIAVWFSYRRWRCLEKHHWDDRAASPSRPDSTCVYQRCIRSNWPIHQTSALADVSIGTPRWDCSDLRQTTRYRTIGICTIQLGIGLSESRMG